MYTHIDTHTTSIYARQNELHCSEIINTYYILYVLSERLSVYILCIESRSVINRRIYNDNNNDMKRAAQGRDGGGVVVVIFLAH